MAKVLGPLHSNSASGSVGSLTYIQAPGGTNVRARITPIKKKTRVQGEYRRLSMGRTAFQFSNISSADQQSWVDFAGEKKVNSSIGQPTKISSIAWYMRFGIVTFYYYNGVLTRPPISLSPAWMPRINVEWTSSGALLSWDETIEDSRAIVVRQWRNLLSTQRSAYRWVFSHLIQFPAVSPMLLTPPAGGDGGPGTLPPIILGRYQEFWLYTTDQGGSRSPYLRFRILADS